MIVKANIKSSEQNKAIIYATIEPYLTDGIEILEVGSGSGEHAIHCASMKPKITWQTSELAESLPALKARIADSQLLNLAIPVELDVVSGGIGIACNLMFSANTFHIMSETQVEKCLLRCAECLKDNGYLIVYGPFNYHGTFTSISNEQFDGWLKSRDPRSGIKHFEWVNGLAAQSGLQLVSDIAMPANNRTLIWRKKTFEA